MTSKSGISLSARSPGELIQRILSDHKLRKIARAMGSGFGKHLSDDFPGIRRSALAWIDTVMRTFHQRNKEGLAQGVVKKSKGRMNMDAVFILQSVCDHMGTLSVDAIKDSLAEIKLSHSNMKALMLQVLQKYDPSTTFSINGRLVDTFEEMFIAIACDALYRAINHPTPRTSGLVTSRGPSTSRGGSRAARSKSREPKARERSKSVDSVSSKSSKKSTKSTKSKKGNASGGPKSKKPKRAKTVKRSTAMIDPVENYSYGESYLPYSSTDIVAGPELPPDYIEPPPNYYAAV